MKQSELDKLNIEIDGKIFTPQYSHRGGIPIRNTNGEIVDFELIDYIQELTAEEVYEKQYSPAPTPEDKITLRLNQQEQALGLLATQLAKNTLLQNGGMR